MIDLAHVTAADFAPHTGSLWRVVGAGPNAASGRPADLGQPIALELVEVSQAPSLVRVPPRSFSLLFRGAPGTLLPQRIYHLENDALGRIDLFLVPIRPDARGPLFEAVFT